MRIANAGAQDSGYGEGLAIVRGTSFQDGAIEVVLSGDTAPYALPQMRGFVGIAFRVSDRSHFECFYILPKNERSEDQLQRNHSTQYISITGFPWDKLRSETPGKYESYVDLIPGQWTKLKIEVKGKIAKLYVNGAEQPTLIVQRSQTAFVEWRYCALGGTRNNRPVCRPKSHTPMRRKK